MTRFLASVRDEREAALALEGGADVIDAKEPRLGALGPVADETLRCIVAAVGGSRPVSATIGDAPISLAAMEAAISARARAGAGYVKFAAPSAEALNAEALAASSKLAAKAAGGAKAIAVLLVDVAAARRLMSEDALRAFAAAGVAGVMLDTAGKNGKGLTDFIPHEALCDFVRRAHNLRLNCGLAGSLRLSDITPLMRTRCDFLGFRGALCDAGREGALGAPAVRAIRAAMDMEPPETENAPAKKEKVEAPC